MAIPLESEEPTKATNTYRDSTRVDKSVPLNRLFVRR